MSCTPQTDRTTTAEVIEAIIDTLRDTDSIDSIVDNANGTATINVTSTGNVVVSQYALPFITIGGVSYEVQSLVVDTSFLISFTGSIPVGTTWKANAPYFHYGQPVEISNEIDKIKKEKSKYPAIVWFDQNESEEELDEVNPVHIVEDMELYFTDTANYEDWKIEEYYTGKIKDMFDLSLDFVQACRDYVEIDELTGTAKRTRMAKFGVTVVRNGKGSADTIFNDNLSAVRLRMDLPIKRSLNDNCC